MGALSIYIFFSEPTSLILCSSDVCFEMGHHGQAPKIDETFLCFTDSISLPISGKTLHHLKVTMLLLSFVLVKYFHTLVKCSRQLCDR